MCATVVSESVLTMAILLKFLSKLIGFIKKYCCFQAAEIFRTGT